MDCCLFKEKCKKFFDTEKFRMLTVIISVFIWGLVAHAYGFLNLTISHDSLNEFYVSKQDVLHRIELGRFITPVYQLLFHGRVNLPWLNGLLSLCWLSVSVWLTTQIFNITNKIAIILVSGVFTVNTTVTALAATYIHDLDADLFAVMLAVYMVYLWYKGGKIAWLGIPFIVGALGLYQSMLSVAISLVMISSIMTLLNGEKSLNVIKKGLQAIAIMIIGGGIYLALVKLSCVVAGTELSTGYNGLTHLFDAKGGLFEYVKLVWDTYYTWIFKFFKSSRMWKEMFVLHLFVTLPVINAVVHAMCKKEIHVLNKILILILGALLPLGMNISHILDGGMSHDLMCYAFFLIYLLAILLVEWYVKSFNGKKVLPKLCYVVTVFSLSIILATDVQTANTAYVKKDLERQATLSVMTTVNADINKIDDYIAGETEVKFIGSPRTGVNEIFPNQYRITGLGSKSQITYEKTYSSYFKYILQTPLNQSFDEIPKEIIDEMTVYPKDGYIKWYDGKLIVKMSD